MEGEIIEDEGVVQLQRVDDEEEWNHEGQTPPHPALEPLHCDTHLAVATRTQRTQPNTTTAAPCQQTHTKLTHPTPYCKYYL